MTISAAGGLLKSIIVYYHCDICNIIIKYFNYIATRISTQMALRTIDDGKGSLPAGMSTAGVRVRHAEARLQPIAFGRL